MTLFGLGDAASTVQSIPGVDFLVDYIKDQAKSGAEGAIPEIQNQVKLTVTPYVITIGLIAGLSLLLSLAAFSKVNTLSNRS